MKLKAFVATAAVLGLSTAAHASALFFDNFDSYTGGLNWVPQGGWTTTDGTVDLVSQGSYGGIQCAGGAGQCIDLDGSSNQSAIFANAVSLVAGQTYTLTFDLIGNNRGYPANTVDVAFGTSTGSFGPLASNAPDTVYSLTFTPTTSQAYTFSFHDLSTNNVGAVLDNVGVQAVPEPSEWALMIAGTGMLAFIAARRRSKHQGVVSTHSALA